MAIDRVGNPYDFFSLSLSGTEFIAVRTFTYIFLLFYVFSGAV